MQNIPLLMAVAIASSSTAPITEKGSDDNGTELFGIATDKSCISGHNPFSNDTTARIRTLSEDTLKKYLGLAGKSALADVRAAFTVKQTTLGWGENSYKKKKITQSWVRDGQPSDISAVDDPVAKAVVVDGQSVDSLLTAEQFLVGGAKFSAVGIWRVAAPGDPNRILGRYRARFLRQNSLGGQTWDLLNIELITGAAKPADIAQYCVEPGDVEYNRSKVEEKKAKQLLK